MKILAVAGTKGGSGKSTVAIHLGGELMLREYRVLIVDGDPQGTVNTWATIAAENQMICPDVHIASPMRLDMELRQFAAQGDFDIALIDCPGVKGEIHKDALRGCHLALLPVGPSPTDLWALSESMDLVRHIKRASNEKMRIAVLMNRMSGTRMAQNALLAINQESHLRKDFWVMEAQLKNRTLYSESLAQGDFVSRHKPSSLAAYEIGNLADGITRALDLTHSATAADQPKVATA